MNRMLHLQGAAGTDLAQTSQYYILISLYLMNASYQIDTTHAMHCMFATHAHSTKNMPMQPELLQTYQKKALDYWLPMGAFVS